MKNNYQIVLQTSGEKYEGQGETINEALASLGLSWEQITAKGVVKVSKGKHTLEHLFYPKQLRRIFANKITRLMWGKRLELLFKENANDL